MNKGSLPPDLTDFLDKWKERIDPPFSPGLGDKLIRRTVECHSCGRRIRLRDDSLHSYNYCPFCGTLLSGAPVTLDQLKILLEEINSKLGRYLETLRRSKLGKV